MRKLSLQESHSFLSFLPGTESLKEEEITHLQELVAELNRSYAQRQSKKNKPQKTMSSSLNIEIKPMSNILEEAKKHSIRVAKHPKTMKKIKGLTDREWLELVQAYVNREVTTTGIESVMRSVGYKGSYGTGYSIMSTKLLKFCRKGVVKTFFPINPSQL